MALRLYNYFRSSASYRVRLALVIKKLNYEYISVHLLRDGGQQKSAEYLSRNPLAQVPTLEHDGKFITQSLAIMLYLEELQPAPALFPGDAYARAKIFEVCEIINSGTQPLHNLSVVAELGSQFGASKEKKDAWTKYWIEKGLAAFDATIAPYRGQFCFGETLTAADVCLIPQLLSSRRFAADVSKFPRLLEIEKNCLRLEAFQLADPARQIDAE